MSISLKFFRFYLKIYSASDENISSPAKKFAVIRKNTVRHTT